MSFFTKVLSIIVASTVNWCVLFQMKILFSANSIHISIICALVTIFFLQLDQTGWAAVINCPATPFTCNGTSGDDIIFAYYPSGNFIHGLAGNDYILGTGTNPNYLFGDEGNDILIGSAGNDALYGGLGNDRYDGGDGADTIYDESHLVGSLVSNDDIISGDGGDDFIASGEGIDKIQGGPGNDMIYPGGYIHRDFSPDGINCGSSTSDKLFDFYSGDGDTANNCEFVLDADY
jgi:Ca2+-binding RTX toxin-like protein